MLRSGIDTIKDYYAFGSIMPGRSFVGANGYRYGFNGKEKDDEVHGSAGTSYDYGMRIYDPRLGRFLSVDPLASSYPFYSPYQFAGNSPIQANDLDGLEPNFKTTPPNTFSNPPLKPLISEEVLKRFDQIDVHMNTIIKAMKFDQKTKEANVQYLKQEINKKLEFDDTGNPKIIQKPVENGGTNALVETVKKTALSQGKRLLRKGVLPLVGITLSKEVVKTATLVFTPMSSGDQTPPNQLQQEKFVKDIDRSINSAIENVYSEKDPLKLQVTQATKDNTSVATRSPEFETQKK